MGVGNKETGGNYDRCS